MKITDQLLFTFIFLALSGIIVFIASLYFKSQRKLEVLDNTATQIVEDYKFQLLEKDSTIAIQQQSIVDKNSKLAKLGDTLSHLKNLQGQIRIKTITKIERDTIRIKEDQILKTDSSIYLKLPYTLSNESKWFGYSFTLDSTQSAVRNDLWFKSDLLIAWGTQDHGNFIKNLLKKNHPLISFQDQNPYSQTKEINNAIYEDFKEKRFKLGLQFGYGITNSGLSPYAGLGLSINL